MEFNPIEKNLQLLEWNTECFFYGPKEETSKVLTEMIKKKKRHYPSVKTLVSRAFKTNMVVHSQSLGQKTEFKTSLEYKVETLTQNKQKELFNRTL